MASLILVWFAVSLHVQVESQTLEFNSTNPIGFIHFYQVYDSGSNPAISVSKSQVDKQINDTTEASWTSFLYENIIPGTSNSSTFHLYNFIYSSHQENIYDDIVRELDRFSPSYFVTVAPFNKSNNDYLDSGYTQCSNCKYSFYDDTTHRFYTVSAGSTNYANIAATILFNDYDSYNDLILLMTNIIFISTMSNNDTNDTLADTFTFSWYALYEEIFGNETIINGDCDDDFSVNVEGVTNICNYYIIIDEMTQFGDIMRNTDNLEANMLETLFLSSTYVHSLNVSVSSGIYARFIPYTTILCRNRQFCGEAFNISTNPTLAPTTLEPTLSPTPNPTNEALKLPYCASFDNNTSWKNEWNYDSNTRIYQRNDYISVSAISCDSFFCTPVGEIIKYFNTNNYVNITIKFKISLSGYYYWTDDDSVQIKYKCSANWQTLKSYADEDKTYNKALKLPSKCDNYGDFGIMFQLSSSVHSFRIYDLCICADNDDLSGDECQGTFSNQDVGDDVSGDEYQGLVTVDVIYIVLWIFYFLLFVVVIIFALKKAKKDKNEFESVNNLQEFSRQNCKGNMWCGCCIGWLIGFLFFGLIPMAVIDYRALENAQSTQCEITSVTYCSYCVCWDSGDDDYDINEQGYEYNYEMVQSNGENFENGCKSITYESDACRSDGPVHYDGDIVDCLAYSGDSCQADFGSAASNYRLLIIFGVLAFIFYLLILYSYYRGFTIWKNAGFICLSTWNTTPKSVERAFEKKMERKRVEMTLNNASTPNSYVNRFE